MTKADNRARSLELYEKLIATNPAVERKGDTMPVYRRERSHVQPVYEKEDQMTLRLPPGELEEFLKKYKTKLSTQYGMIMKEYAVVPDQLLAKTRELQKYFDISYKYVSSLKPKPARKKKTAGKS